MRILRIKKRSPAMGLILIASSLEQLSDWVDLPDGSETLASDADAPVTWIVPAAGDVPTWIRGEHTTIAVRITRHPVAAALCDAADSPLVSTSANLSGRRPARNPYILRRNFGHLVDYIVPGRCGPAGSASEIRDLETGKTLRAAST
jgi:L-threonylcarbamoyladenylate synthase